MSKKPGRNDPCPCGSGKKYKQCCWGKEDRKTYTSSGKRKFKAKLLSGGAGKSQQVFQSASTGASDLTDMGSLDALKFRMTGSDYRKKKTEETPLPFKIPTSESQEPTEKRKPSEEPSPPPEGEFKEAKEDFREKEGET